jgi:hypothetical protein
MSGLKERVLAAVESRDAGELEALIASDRRAVRHLVGFTFCDDAGARRIAAHGLAFAGRRHPAVVGEIVRRLTWAMNEESATNAVWAPDALRAIAEEAPELLLPVIPDLLRLSADPALRERLTETARLVAARYPAEAAGRMERSLADCMRGERHGRGRERRA